MAKRIRVVGLLTAAALFASALVVGTAPQQAAAAAPSIPTTSSGAPSTLPALQNWTAGSGSFQYRTTTGVVAPTALAEVAGQIATDLGNALDETVAVKASGATAGDVQLSLDPSTSDELGDEGYRVEITDKISITAATETGLFYGGQSAAQWAVQAGLSKSVPAGSSTDVPAYPVRGVGVCACIVQISMEKFEETIREMAYYKMNELWLEIKVESEAFPLATFWSYYTTEQAQHISEFAARHHVRIVAEVNSPGHMEPWIAPYPELQLVNRNGVAQTSQLDITKPEALETITTLADEYFDHFPDMDYWHMGADEYLLGSGSLTDYPQFKEKALELFGDQGREIDVFIRFINDVNEHVKSRGKQLRIWNDGLVNLNVEKLDSDIIIEDWYRQSGQNPRTWLEDGHDLVNADAALYFTRNNAWGTVENNWNRNWTPKNFHHTGVVDDSTTSGKVLGGKLTLWPDNGPGMTENQLFGQARPTMRLVAQATWGSPRPVSAYADFAALGDRVGTGPSTVAIDWTPVPAGEYIISSDALFLNASGETVSATADKSSWTLTTTGDGYYKIASGANCLVPTGSTANTLNTPQQFGDSPKVAACASGGAANNLQKWWIKEAEGGYSLINAITQLPLFISDEGKVTQEDPNHNTAAVFTFIGDGVTTTTTFADRLVAGTTTKLNVSTRNLSDAPAGNVVITPTVPTGWLVSPASMNLGELAAQQVTDFSFSVTPNAGPATQTALTLVTTFSQAGESDSRTVNVPVAFSCSADVTSPSEVVRFSSQQNDSNEVALAINSIDGNPNTFWHSRWSPSEAQPPHELAFGLSEEATFCAVSLTPRQGVSSGAANGQIKDYELYATSDPTVAQGTDLAAWGEPVKAGSLPAGQSVNWVPLDEPVTAKYILLRVLGAQVASQSFATLGEFSVDMASTDEAAPVIGAVADVAVEVGDEVEVVVRAADASLPLSYAATGLPVGVSIDPATGVISGEATEPGTHQVTVRVTDAADNLAEVAFTITVTAKPSPTPTASPSQSVKPSPSPTGKPTVTPDVPRSAPYTLPGTHVLNGRTWFTRCEGYSQTERCRTEIWATTVVKNGSSFEVRQGWAFNNLTYLPMMTRDQWKGNPLGETGAWSAPDGRKWRTECDTAATGANGCRSYTWTTVYSATPKAGGGYTFSQSGKWVFNNIVQFR